MVRQRPGAVFDTLDTISKSSVPSKLIVCPADGRKRPFGSPNALKVIKHFRGAKVFNSKFALEAASAVEAPIRDPGPDVFS